MIEQLSNSVVFYAFYVASKTGSTGLTVTIDVYEGTTGTPIVSGGNATELGGGLYYYTLASGSVDAVGEYLAVFKTSDSNVDQQHLPAIWSVGRAGIENLDATISGVAASAATAVWAAGTRTLTAFGTLATDVWAAATRTLTQGAASVTAAVSGSTITVYRGTTWSIALTGLGDIATYDKVYFSVKETFSDSDNDAICRVDETDGLERFNKAAPVASGNGTITRDDESAGDITIEVNEAETVSALLSTRLVYDVKGVDADGNVDLLSSGGVFTISGDVTRAIT